MRIRTRSLTCSCGMVRFRLPDIRMTGHVRVELLGSEDNEGETWGGSEN